MHSNIVHIETYLKFQLITTGNSDNDIFHHFFQLIKILSFKCMTTQKFSLTHN